MKGATGTGLVIVGFILLYLALTDKLDCLFAMFDCMFGTNTVQATGKKIPISNTNAKANAGSATAFAWRDFRV